MWVGALAVSAIDLKPKRRRIDKIRLSTELSANLPGGFDGDPLGGVGDPTNGLNSKSE